MNSFSIDFKKLKESLGLIFLCFGIGLICGIALVSSFFLKTSDEQINHVENLLQFGLANSSQRYSWGGNHYLFNENTRLGFVRDSYFGSYHTLARMYLSLEIRNLCGMKHIDYDNSTLSGNRVSLEELFQAYPEEKENFKQMCKEIQ